MKTAAHMGGAVLDICGEMGIVVALEVGDTVGICSCMVASYAASSVAYVVVESRVMTSPALMFEVWTESHYHCLYCHLW